MSNGQIERWIKKLQKHQSFLLNLKCESEKEQSSRECEILKINKEKGLLFDLLRLRSES